MVRKSLHKTECVTTPVVAHTTNSHGRVCTVTMGVGYYSHNILFWGVSPSTISPLNTFSVHFHSLHLSVCFNMACLVL